mmetsp:Transcript_80180/g.238810  ORF Transcript_80180/g.238810 Transcript_80180/m.238810 type:complete len:226 (-) Transcript_80180:202-879(-)
MGDTLSESSATPPRIVSAIFSWPTICEPTAPRPATTKSCERFRMVAGTLESRTASTTDSLLPGSFTSRRTGARPSAAADHRTMSTAEGRDIQARSAQGSNLSLWSLVSIFCCSEAFAARRTLLSMASARPRPEKRTSPREQTMQPATTRLVGQRSLMSNGMPSMTTMGMDMSGWVAMSISVRATEHRSSTLFPTPMQVAKHTAIGRIVKRNSFRLGTGTGRPWNF